MIATISLLTALAFAAMYPLCFWISADTPLQDNFHKFHIGLPNTVGGVVLVFIWLSPIPLNLKIIVTVWKTVFIAVSSYSWKKSYPDPKLMTVAVIFGIYAFVRVQAYYIGTHWTLGFIGVLNGLIFCAALFTMNLGHWYLNVHGLPMGHLRRAMYVFWGLIGLRLVWDMVYLCIGKVQHNGYVLSLFQFLFKMDGFFLLIGFLFGIIFPIIALYFVKEVLKLKNTQSATGILYVILCAVLLGDMTFKYYLIKFGIPL